MEGVSIPEDSLILSLDVVLLYTNIPHEELRNVLQETLDTREVLHPHTHFVLDLIDTFLENNYFRYDSKFYLQIKGVAMGSAFVPSAANLFMHHFEQKNILNPINNPFFWQHL